MRGAILAFLCILTAGCTSDADPDAGAVVQGASPAPPDALLFAGQLKGLGYAGLSPVGLPADPLPPCAMGEAQCAVHAVEVPAGNWTVTFTLVGSDGQATSSAAPATGYGTDYDLFVDGVGESTNGSGEADVVMKKLPAGTYNAQVLAWHDVDGAYTLTVSFS